MRAHNCSCLSHTVICSRWCFPPCCLDKLCLPGAVHDVLHVPLFRLPGHTTLNTSVISSVILLSLFSTYIRL